MSTTSIPQDILQPAQRFASAANEFLLRAVPVVSARTLAVCRIVFSGLLLLFWLGWGSPETLSSASRGAHYTLNDVAPIIWLSGNPLACDIVYYLITGGLIFLLFGILSRVLYPLLVATFWLAVLMMNSGHVMTPLLLALTATLPARWSDAWSIDNLLGFTRPTAGKSKLYGYPIWLLGLCVALAYCAAGLSKLVITKGAWLWGTGARWGFLADMGIAATDWGVYFINNYWLALAASIFSSLGQIVYLWASFTTSGRVKAAIGFGVALPFLVGLIAFMGLFWWPWGVLVLILYMPWRTIDRLIDRAKATAVETSARLSWASCAATLLICAHAVAVIGRFEFEPLISNYPMYALAFPAKSDFEKREWSQYKTYDRNFRYSVLVDTPGRDIEDHSVSVRVAELASRFLGYRHPAVGFAPSRVWHYAAKHNSVPPQICSDLQYFLTETSRPPSLIIYGRHYYDLNDGIVSWLKDSKTLRIRVGTTCEFE